MELNKEFIKQLTGLTERELKEILHALHYEKFCNHGTTGHNQLLLIAKLAKMVGFVLGDDNASIKKVYEMVTISNFGDGQETTG